MVIQLFVRTLKCLPAASRNFCTLWIFDVWSQSIWFVSNFNRYQCLNNVSKLEEHINRCNYVKLLAKKIFDISNDNVKIAKLDQDGWYNLDFKLVSENDENRWLTTQTRIILIAPKQVDESQLSELTVYKNMTDYVNCKIIGSSIGKKLEKLESIYIGTDKPKYYDWAATFFDPKPFILHKLNDMIKYSPTYMLEWLPLDAVMRTKRFVINCKKQKS